jgi:hypothetical protein
MHLFLLSFASFALANIQPSEHSLSKSGTQGGACLRELPVEVQHFQDADTAGWFVSQTANFRAFHKGDPETATQVCRTAERARAATHHKWFGNAPKTWDCRCDIYLHPNASAFAIATGVPEAVPGHSTFRYDSGRLISRRIDLHCDCPTLLSAVLPHEAAHTVLHGMFTKEALPRWANEGMAVLGEPMAQIKGHLTRLRQYREAGLLLDVQALVEMWDYPTHHVAAFYAQSVSLVAFLAASKDPPVFTRFLRDARHVGYEKALQNHYGWSFSELDQRWQAFAFREDSVTINAQTQ